MSRINHITICSVLAGTIAALVAASPAAAGDLYTMVDLGRPPNADSAVGIRMNDFGHIAGYSIYYAQGEPSMKPWVWTPETGYTVLPPPPDMFLGRARAMDISNSGIVAGDGGFDAGIAWRYENGAYETFGNIEGLPAAYLGGVNEAGNVVGTARDAQFTTPDDAFLDINGGGTINLTPGPIGGRATDLNEVGQVCGYSAGFQAVRWDEEGYMQSLGTAGLAYSFAAGMNDDGTVVGSAQSASGFTTRAWIYTDEFGQQLIPVPLGSGPVTINNQGQVVGNTTPGSGPDYGWLWTPQVGMRTIFDLYDYSAAGYSGVVARDINEAGQILAYGYNYDENEYRTLLLTPIEGALGACCLPDGGCATEVTEADCLTQGGEFLGFGTTCISCIPVGACCRNDGSCLEFMTGEECDALAGTWQGADTSCLQLVCPVGVINDDCADALAITIGDTIFSTLGATTDGPILPDTCPQSAGQYFNNDIWYTFTPESTGVLRVSTCNQTDYDSRLAAYHGTCDALDLITCADDSPGCFFGSTEMDVEITSCDPVLIRIGSFSVYHGSGTLTLEYIVAGEPCVTCPADFDGSGDVGFSDLLALLGGWGECGSECVEDIDGDGNVNFADLLIVLGTWGPC